MNNPGNNGGNGAARACNLFGKESVNYPVKFDLKAIIDASIKSEESIASLENIFKKHAVPFSNWRQKESSGGKYISYTVNVTVESQQVLENVYAALKMIKGLKFAI
jgi:putative lipoic acid-binding regulatory protein